MKWASAGRGSPCPFNPPLGRNRVQREFTPDEEVHERRAHEEEHQPVADKLVGGGVGGLGCGPQPCVPQASNRRRSSDGPHHPQTPTLTTPTPTRPTCTTSQKLKNWLARRPLAEKPVGRGREGGEQALPGAGGCGAKRGRASPMLTKRRPGMPSAPPKTPPSWRHAGHIPPPKRALAVEQRGGAKRAQTPGAGSLSQLPPFPPQSPLIPHSP